LQFDAQGQLAKRYLYGPAVDQVLAEETLHEDSGTGELLSDGVRWPLADHLGTVRGLADHLRTLRDWPIIWAASGTWPY